MGSDSSTHNLTANLAGLVPGTIYHYRIVASNAKGTEGGTNHGLDETFQTLGPTVDVESFSEVGSAGASLTAEINDHGVSSTYHYEYGTSTSYGSMTPATSLGAVDKDLAAPAELERPATRHDISLPGGGHTNSLGVSPGADLTFTTFSPIASGLPDGRVYELVSPAVARPGREHLCAGRGSHSTE